MTNKQYAQAIYRAAALKARITKRTITASERKELRSIEVQMDEFETKQDKRADKVLMGMFEGSTRRG